MDNLLAFITVVPHILNKQEIEDLLKKHPKAKITYRHDSKDGMIETTLHKKDLLLKVVKYCVELIKESDSELLFQGYLVEELW